MSKAAMSKAATRHRDATAERTQQALDKLRRYTRGGRPFNLPWTEEEAIDQISQRSRQWLRWYGELEEAEDVGVADLPDGAQKRLKAVERAMRPLEEEEVAAE